MKDLFKIFSLICFILLSFNLQAQDDYDDEDLEFKAYSKKKSRAFSENKRKFNMHFSAGYNLSTVFGADVSIFKDTMNAVKNRYGFDSYKIEPSYFPYGAIDFSFNFSQKISMTLGLKYNKLGWREVAKYNDARNYYKFFARYDFHYLSTAIGFQYHPHKNVSIYAGHTFSALVKNDLYIEEIQVFNGDTITNFKQKENFTTATGVETLKLTTQLFLGAHFGFDRIRFNINAVYTPTFINANIRYNNIALEAGILFKLFKDYDNEL